MADELETVTLPGVDLAFLLSGLEVLAEQWEATERWLQTGEADPSSTAPCVREGHDPEEAAWLAAEYRAVISRIREQRNRGG